MALATFGLYHARKVADFLAPSRPASFAVPAPRPLAPPAAVPEPPQASLRAEALASATVAEAAPRALSGELSSETEALPRHATIAFDDSVAKPPARSASRAASNRQGPSRASLREAPLATKSAAPPREPRPFIDDPFMLEPGARATEERPASVPQAPREALLLPTPIHTGALPSCEAAIADAEEEVVLGAPRGPVDVSREAYASLLEDGRYLAPCRVPSRTVVEVCVAVKNGRALGVSVRTLPSGPALNACVRRAVAGLSFPTSARLDVTHTRFEAVSP